MLWNYTSSEQVSGWRRLFDRRSVGQPTDRLVLDSSKNTSAALTGSAAVAVPIVGLCLMLAAFIPASQVQSLRVLADRTSGGLYNVPEGCR